jgi:hypothetical protein
VTYDSIVLYAGDVVAAAAPYASDSAYGAPGTTAETAATCGTADCTTNEATKTVTGADNRSYRVDTYITWHATASQTSPPTAGRLVKRVTVVVRDTATPATEYARAVSSFDEATGLAG